MLISDWSSDVCSSDLTHWRTVRRRPVRPALGAQDGAQPPVVAGVRRTADRALALGLARRGRGALDAGRDGTAGARLLRQQVCAGAGPTPRQMTTSRTCTEWKLHSPCQDNSVIENSD